MSLRPLILVLTVLAACGGSGRDPIPTSGATPQECPNGGSCSCVGDGASCDISCADTACSINCSSNGLCGVVGCHDITGCTLVCSSGAHCNYVDCRGATGCEVTCSGGAHCDLNCEGATNCGDVMCTGGAECLIYCADATSCGFSHCVGAQTSCDGNVVTCNRACPSCGDGACDRVAGETCSTCGLDCGHC